MIYIIFILIKPFSYRLCPKDGGILFLEETARHRTEMFHQLCIDLQCPLSLSIVFLEGAKPWQQKNPQQAQQSHWIPPP